MLNIQGSLHNDNKKGCSTIGISKKNWCAIFDKLELMHGKGGSFFFPHKGNNYFQIKKIHTINYSGRVYNLEVEEDNSYTANFMAVHNCLSTFESQMAGMVVITSDMGALHTTVNDYGNYKIVGDPKSAEYKRTFIKYLVNTINDDKEFEELSNYNRKKALEDKNDWKDISIEWQKNIWKVLS